jgi:hypothetical protein
MNPAAGQAHGQQAADDEAHDVDRTTDAGLG